MTHLLDWQRTVLDRVLNPSNNNIMVVAESGHGKTYVLKKVLEETSGTLLTGYGKPEDVDTAISGPNDIVLLDEAGAFSHSFELAKLLEENPDTQVVVATLPDCPSMEMIKPRFEIVRGRERAEF